MYLKFAHRPVNPGVT